MRLLRSMSSLHMSLLRSFLVSFMDPACILGVASNGLQLTQLAFSAFINLITYYSDIQKAPAQSKTLRQELDSFVDVLGNVERCFGCRGLPQDMKKEFGTIHDLLETLYSRTTPKSPTGIRTLKWPFQQKETQEFISKIQRSKSNLQLLMDAQTQFAQSQI